MKGTWQARGWGRLRATLGTMLVATSLRGGVQPWVAPPAGGLASPRPGGVGGSATARGSPGAWGGGNDLGLGTPQDQWALGWGHLTTMGTSSRDRLPPPGPPHHHGCWRRGHLSVATTSVAMSPRAPAPGTRHRHGQQWQGCLTPAPALGAPQHHRHQFQGCITTMGTTGATSQWPSPPGPPHHCGHQL